MQAKKLTDVAVAATGAALKFYDDVIEPGLTANLTAFSDAIGQVSVSATQAYTHARVVCACARACVCV